MKMIEKNIPENWKLHVEHQHTNHGRLDATVAVILDKITNRPIGAGRALVNHRKEKSPSRKMGRHIAVGRAMVDAYKGGVTVNELVEFERVREVSYTQPEEEYGVPAALTSMDAEAVGKELGTALAQLDSEDELVYTDGVSLHLEPQPEREVRVGEPSPGEEAYKKFLTQLFGGESK